MSTLIEVSGVSLTYRRGRQTIDALVDVSLSLEQGTALGVVGESGSGKTTLGRVITRLTRPDSGRVLFDGADVLDLCGNELLAYRRAVQMVFQNSAVAFNPRRSVASLLMEPYAIHRLAPKSGRRSCAIEALRQVGLPESFLDRHPHQLSGGQRQRVGLARALATSPRLLVADEPVSALDVSVQAQVLNLIAQLRESQGLTLLMISHDVRAIHFLCEQIAVMYLGRVVEIGSRLAIMEHAQHPYTSALISAVPDFRPGGGFSRRPLPGEAGERAPDDRGCLFAPRCPRRRALGDPNVCVEERPPLRQVGGTTVACHFADMRDPVAEAAQTSAG